MPVCFDVNAVMYHICDLTPFFVSGYTTIFLFSFRAMLVFFWYIVRGLRRIYQRISSRRRFVNCGIDGDPEK